MDNLNNGNIYKCPVCQLRLEKNEKQFVCGKGHSFDISHNNYVNLLIDNQKKSKDPGDSKEMMESRRAFLNKEYYLKFSNKLNEIIDEFLQEDAEYILDAGCGEGYYLTKLKNYLMDKEKRRYINYYGIDISKSAIKYASKRDKDINFAVGSNFNLPILDKSIDCIIRNFAPGDNEEFHRVLGPTGKLIIITPGIDHLYGLKEKLYEIARKHEIRDTTIAGFALIFNSEIKYSVELRNNQDIKNLISMTPYYWSITHEMRESLDLINEINTYLHFNIDIYKKI